MGSLGPEERNPTTSNWRFWKTRRRVVALMAFLGVSTSSMMKSNLSIALSSNTESHRSNCSNSAEFYSEDVIQALFYGLIDTQLLGGWLGWRFGGARVFGVAIFASSVATLVTPFVVNVTSYSLVEFRIIVGLFLGTTYPAIIAVWSKWAPKMERSRMLTLGFSGEYFGHAVLIWVFDFFTSEKIKWFVVFYTTGAVGLIFGAFWWFFVVDDPERDRWIGEKERSLIKSSLASESAAKSSLQWKEQLASFPLWALSLAHFCENWGFSTYVTHLTVLLKDTRGYDKAGSDYLLSFVLLLMAFTMLSAGHLSDWMCNIAVMSKTNIRKLFICLGSVLQALFTLLSTSLITTAKFEICLSLVMALGAFVSTAINGNHLDLSAEHASVLMGITNTFGTLAAILCPIVTGYIAANKTTEEWEIVLNIAAGFHLLGALCYGVFGSASNQDWTSINTISQAVSANEVRETARG